ncbi:hypothetical protein CHH69_17375 [Terribacillus saccharophilus]|uniref:hypothetical protein n=1 Tax=Terribacillus saccharophilus TaxID=361277 RepID=UPI000BA73795|nr:hypothetical protein [Terribacillus saccharophilus]PAF23107.1 hypothetical protein CHH49_00665 [Terribacillus saccharophilus]PAF34136.1 hypothetical protein CHH69_17375 [Terribacillus saccharophilus]PAF36795.1 hypothetical protein CHH58_08020 [Terribacillus saccharophilus]
MFEKLSVNWLIIATFGVSSATAATISAIIVKMVGGGLTWSRAIALIAATGVGAIVVAGIAAVGFAWLSSYINKNGESGLTQW